MGAREGMTLGPVYEKRCCRRIGWLAVFVMTFSATAGARAQDTTGPPASGQSSGTAATTKNPTGSPGTQQANTANEAKTELSTKDTDTTFKLRVNLVQVKVVVRDGKGELVRDLKREDFQVYDQGKVQTITTFGVETPETRRKRMEAAAKTQQGADEAVVGERAALPERFVALVFDDIHLKMEDAVAVRLSAKKLVDSMAPEDRIGIFGTSGQLKVEYTNDKAALEKALLQVLPRPKMGKINDATNCPDVTHYMADQAINKSDTMVLGVVTQETLQCMFQGNPQMAQAAQTVAQSALQEQLVAGDSDNEYMYRVLEEVIRRLATLPGERVLVLASPGFLLSTQTVDEMGIIDRANRASIVINTVDARGLYTPDMGDISKPDTDTPQTAGLKASYRTQEQLENGYVLGDIAYGTGGTFFHNSNDLEGGLNRAGGTPEVSYILGFSPQNQKMDGRYHTIKVVITEKRKYQIQARRGYYAPKKVDDPQEQAKAEMQEAVFSQDEIQDLPLNFQTQYFKISETDAHLSVVSRIDLKGIHFRKADGRNFDNLTVATAIFDENGNYVTGGEKILEMRLLDKTYDRLSQTGLVMKSSFELKPGKYMVRQVVRDSEGAQMAAKNGAVVIPD
jgi:VWFA-related protein